MEEGPPPRGGGSSGVRNTLNQACRVLRGLITHLEGDSESAEAPTSATSQPHQASNILAEHRRLFTSRSLGSTPRVSNRRSRTRTSSQPYHRHMPTHTHTFVCLAEKNTIDVPKSENKQLLYCNGLGERRVQLFQADDSNAVHEKILKQYPKLKDVGSYTFLQSGPSNKLVPIPEPPEGFSAKYVMALGSSKVYIRPEQNIRMQHDTGGPSRVSYF